jgi:hypothetical protein
MMRTTCVVLTSLVVGAVACGGGKQKAEPVYADDGGDGGGGDDGGDAGADDMVAPETMDEIRVRLDRKRGQAARCLSDAVLAGHAPRNARGKITLEFVISTAGKAQDITVAKASLTIPEIHQCVIEKVKDIGFPELPRPLEWSYTFAFESM